jgi:hypothetical protein
MWAAAFVLSLVATVLLITSAMRTPSVDSIALALLGVAVLLGISVTRLVATRLQDRIIRAEMLIRLGALGRAADMGAVTEYQAVNLRKGAPPLADALQELEKRLLALTNDDHIGRCVPEHVLRFGTCVGTTADDCD